MKRVGNVIGCSTLIFVGMLSCFGGSVPSPAVCVRACPDGAASAKRLWNGISPRVKEWELGKRDETLKRLEDHQFGKTPIGRPADEKLGERSIEFTDSGLRIDIACGLPKGASAAHPVPVFLFGGMGEGAPTNSIRVRGYASVRWAFVGKADTYGWQGYGWS